MRTIIISLAFLFWLPAIVQTQTLKSSQGFFCGFSEGDAGYITLRIGNSKKSFTITGDDPAPVGYVGFNNDRQRRFDQSILGTEMVIQYVFKKPKGWSSATNVVRKITLTGKVDRQTRSCGFGLY